MFRRFGMIAFALAASACAVAPQTFDYTAFRADHPRSLLVLPALNNTAPVEAADIFHSTVSRPFAERGYYVFPAHMVKSILEQDGLSDSSLAHQADARRLERLFGCDAALYISIEKWESQYLLLSISTNVEVLYSLKSCKSGDVLWTSHQTMMYQPQQGNGSGNPLADIIAAAVLATLEKAAPNYIPLAQMANLQAAGALGSGIPAGPYLPALYQKDVKEFPVAAPQAQSGK